MTKTRRICTGFGVVFLISILAACGGKTTVESDLGVSGAPGWVNEGTQILNDKDGRRFHGVGQAPTMGDEALQISTADDRARAEVARILTSYMEVVSDDYSTSTASSGAGGQRSGEQNVSRQIHNLTRVNLSGARILGHWKDRKSGNVYSIAELDLANVQQTLDAVDDLNGGLKGFIRGNGGNIFDRLVRKGGVK